MARLKSKDKDKVTTVNGQMPDALEDLLNAIAASYENFPDLWLDEELRYAATCLG